MTRSGAAAQTAAIAGAEPVRGDVTDPASLSAAARGCEVVIHAAGRMGASPSVDPFLPVNVTGRSTGAPVHLPWRGNEPARQPPADHRRGRKLATAATTLLWIRGVQDTRRPGRSSRQCRPDDHGGDPARLGLGHHRRSVNRQLRAGSARRPDAPIDGGRHRIVATHIDNLTHAVGLAIDHGSGGCGYYVFDDGSATVRDFLAGLLQAHGLILPEAPSPGRPQPAWLGPSTSHGASPGARATRLSPE
jgi:nucleoside-diphosphate-sugar epimerase